MKSYLNRIPSRFEADLNKDLMRKAADEDLVQCVIESFKSLEAQKHIKFMGAEFTDEESKIDINKYVYRRTKRKKKSENYPTKYINDSRVGKLRCHFRVSLMETKPDGTEFLNVHPIHKDILIPLQDENGFYQINGKRYYLIYQMVEKSTYTSSQSVTLKSLMPVNITRNRKNMKDVDGNVYTLPWYVIYIFNKQTPVLYFYLAKGFNEGLEMLGVRNYIDVSPSLPDEEERDPDSLYFEISPTIYVSTKKYYFEDTYIKSIVCGLKAITTNRFTYSDLFNPETWIKRIPSTVITQNSLERGSQILEFFNRLLDETTRRILKVHPYHKQDIYCLVRWMMQEFNTLRLKNNMDLANKRIRCSEYIASLLTKELSYKLNRVMSLGKRATWDIYKDIFKFSGDILLQKMHSSGVLRFDDNVNDMDFFARFKYTSKGPHSLGNKNTNNVGIKYRDIDPSFIGNIDCFVCGNADPGLSGLLSPFGHMKGLYFDDSDEPDTWAYDMEKKAYEQRLLHDEDGTYIRFTFNNPDDYYDCLLKMKNFNDSIQAGGTSKAGGIIVEVQEEISPDDKTAAIPH